MFYIFNVNLEDNLVNYNILNMAVFFIVHIRLFFTLDSGYYHQ